MPKNGLSDEDWRDRMREYALGKFTFGKGQRPPPDSKWTKTIERISKCPLKTNPATRGLFGRTIECTCGYHLMKPTASSNSSTLVPVFVKPSPLHRDRVSETSKLALPADEKDSVVVSTSKSSVGSGHDHSIDNKDSLTKSTLSVEATVVPLLNPASEATPPVLPPVKDTPPKVPPVKETPPEFEFTTGPGCLGEEPKQLAGSLLCQKETSPRKPDYSLRLPVGWKNTLEENDLQWIGQHLFAKKGELVSKLSTWWYPPPVPGPQMKSSPVVASYFQRRLFLWMPRKMWAFDFVCPTCKPATSLTSKGLYNRVRIVIDLKNKYYLATEYLECRACKGTFISHDSRLIDQLPVALKVRFPVVLTRKFACDQSVVALMRARTLGNSPTAVCHDELYTEEWMRCAVSYLSDCDRHKKGRESMKLDACIYNHPPELKSLPTPKWFLATYVRDVWSRLPSLKASATSIYGSVLKIDSTKKITRKLQGKAADSAAWCTNIGNERGEVLISLLTTSESLSNLSRMAEGLMDRYAKASQPDPEILYTDRDCCKSEDRSKLQRLFHRWEKLIVRLDSWHFMRRLAKACSNESHPLYGQFMGKLSSAIFEWDESDVDLLRSAKRKELELAGLRDPPPDAVTKAITKSELARHCRRRTRGIETTTRLVENLFHSLLEATDSLGVPLFREEVMDIWHTEKLHVKCLQDPSGVKLYTKTGEMTKGGVVLPTYRCARGTTSLESLHNHLKNFIPGTAANDMHYQAYLMEGIHRWNTSRASAAIDSVLPQLRSFDFHLQDRIHHLSSSVLGIPVNPNYRAPAIYTGELIGIEYLYAETGMAVTFTVDVDRDIDEGIEDVELCDLSPSSADNEPVDPEMDLACLAFIDPQRNDDTSQDEDIDDQTSLDYKSLPGWDKVDKLAAVLVKSDSLSLTEKEAEEIVKLYDNLAEYDKKPLTYSRSFQPTRGRFGRTKNSSGHVGQEAMKRCFISAGAPSLPPSKSRVVEAICIRLTNSITSAKKDPVYISRNAQILHRYNEIRSRVIQNPLIMSKTGLSLYQINEKTLSLWLKNQTRVDEVKILIQGIQVPTPEFCSQEPLPPANVKPNQPSSTKNPMMYEDPTDTTGQANVRGRDKPSTSSHTENRLVLNADQIIELEPEAIHEFTGLDEAPKELPKPAPTVSRTTAWRKRKAEFLKNQTNLHPEPSMSSKTSEKETGASKDKKTRKEYSCSKCHQPMSSVGHTQFKGRRHCVSHDKLSKEEWLAEMQATFQLKPKT